MTFIDMIIRLTVVLWRIVLPMFPHHNTMKTRLTCYYTSLMSHPRITPNGSRKREVIGPLFYFILNSILLAKRTFSSIENTLFSNRKHRFRGM